MVYEPEIHGQRGAPPKAALPPESQEVTEARMNDPEWRSVQQVKRALYEQHRASYHTDNPHRSRESIASHNRKLET